MPEFALEITYIHIVANMTHSLPFPVKMPTYELFCRLSDGDFSRNTCISNQNLLRNLYINLPMATTATKEQEQHCVLVVDDLEVNRTLMSKQLGRQGYLVLEAENGPRALEMVETENIDIVLLDIRMPGMDGLEVLRRIRKSHSPLNLPIIMVTAEAITEVTVEALQSGANDYLVKPVDITAAVARIETQLNLVHMASVKDDIIRFASHDLKKPLIIMLDIAQVLSEELEGGKPAPDDSREIMEILVKTGKNMQNVISGFLDQEVLRQDQEKRNYQPLDMNAIALASVESNSEYATRKQIKLTHDLQATSPMVAANEFRLMQILDNLIGNAMKYCPVNATVNVVTKNADDEVFVEIVDNGPGLQEEDFPKLFIKHAKLSNQPTGDETSTGVGLALCKQLIKLDEGSIGARNNPDTGSTFWISLPVN